MSVFAGAVVLVVVYVAVVMWAVLRAKREAARETSVTFDARGPLYCQGCGCRYTHPNPWTAIGDRCRGCVSGTLALLPADEPTDRQAAAIGDECEAWLRERAR